MKTYRGVIEGKPQNIKGWNESGQLVLATGERFVVEPLGAEAGYFRSLTVLRIARLTFTGGAWLLDGRPLVALRQQLMLQPASSATDSRLLTYAKLEEVLKDSRPAEMNPRHPAAAELRARTVGVAWLEELREEFSGQELALGMQATGFEAPPATVHTPVLLAALRSLGRVQRAGKVKRAGARLSPDFSMARLPGKTTEPVTVVIEQELQGLIGRIIREGGEMSRQALVKCYHAKYQPEKLLESKAGRQLIRAGLIGRRKIGRSTVYWARRRA